MIPVASSSTDPTQSQPIPSSPLNLGDSPTIITDTPTDSSNDNPPALSFVLPLEDIAPPC